MAMHVVYSAGSCFARHCVRHGRADLGHFDNLLTLHRKLPFTVHQKKLCRIICVTRRRKNKTSNTRACAFQHIYSPVPAIHEPTQKKQQAYIPPNQSRKQINTQTRHFRMCYTPRQSNRGQASPRTTMQRMCQPQEAVQTPRNQTTLQRDTPAQKTKFPDVPLLTVPHTQGPQNVRVAVAD